MCIGSGVYILFLGKGNSCRSIMSEAIFNHRAPEGLEAMSAGCSPPATLHPRALALLEHHGISTDGYYSKSWEDVVVTPDVLVTVSDDLEHDACPLHLRGVMHTHWGVFDPDQTDGTDEGLAKALAETYAILDTRIQALFALPPEQIQGDAYHLKLALDDIGMLGA